MRNYESHFNYKTKDKDVSEQTRAARQRGILASRWTTPDFLNHLCCSSAFTLPPQRCHLTTTPVRFDTWVCIKKDAVWTPLKQFLCTGREHRLSPQCGCPTETVLVLSDNCWALICFACFHWLMQLWRMFPYMPANATTEPFLCLRVHSDALLILFRF